MGPRQAMHHVLQSSATKGILAICHRIIPVQGALWTCLAMLPWRMPQTPSGSSQGAHSFLTMHLSHSPPLLPAVFIYISSILALLTTCAVHHTCQSN